MHSTQETLEPTSTYISSLIDWTSDEDVDDGNLRDDYTPWQLQSTSPTSTKAPTLYNDMDTINQPTFSSSDSNSHITISDDASIQGPNSNICDGEDDADMDISDSDDEEDTEVYVILDLQMTLIGVLTAQQLFMTNHENLQMRGTMKMILFGWKS